MPTKPTARAPARNKVIAKGDFWTVRAAARPQAAEVLIYGDIGESWWGESVSAKDLVQQLNDIDATEIDVRINSYGGSVADGVSIYNALRRHAATINVTVDGVAVSIASLIAMAGDSVQMGIGSLYMVHAPWAGAVGNANDMRTAADMLDKYAEAMVSAYTRRLGEDRADDVRDWLTDGADHWFTAAEAVTEGFADEATDTTELPAAASGSAAFQALFTRFDLPAAAAASLKERYMPKPTEAAPNPVAAAPTPVVAAPAQAPAATVADLKAEARAFEAERQTEIRELFAIVESRPDAQRFTDVRDRCLVDASVTVDVARDRLLTEMGKGVEPIAGSQRVEPGAMDERDTLRTAAAAALLNRAMPSQHSMTEQARSFRGMSLVRLAEEVVRANGINTRGMSSAEIAVKALHSTSDFPAILESVVTKTLRRAYDEAPQTFRPWTNRGSNLPDFKEVSRAQLAGAPNLLRVVEGGEYQFGTIGEGAEKYRAQKYGRMIGITWETVINDDLNAFTRIPQMFGRSALDLESDIVYGMLTANAAMSDGTALFHADHSNLGTTGAPSETTLSEMRKLMRLQKGIEGRVLNLRPEFLLVPPSLETVTDKLLALSIVPAKTVDANPFYQRLQPIVEARLEDSSATAWYGVASPAQIDTIEYAYLDGHEGVWTETKQGFEVDGLMIKCRHVFAAKAIDHRGLFRNG